jgi:Icc protein
MSNDDVMRQSRRDALKCMAWAGAGIVWTVSGGIPAAMALGDATKGTRKREFSFAQISDSHIGFTKEPNPDPASTLQTAIAQVRAAAPSFLVHTGDVSHLSKAEEFDTASQIVRSANLDTFYIPGEHDVLEDDGHAFFARFSPQNPQHGWYSFDQNGVHFVALVNVLNLKAGGLGYLGEEQLAWLKDDLRKPSASTPIVVLTHIPLWAVYPQWGWGTDDSLQALSLLKRFGSVTVLNGHIHQVLQKVEGDVSFYSAASTAFPQPAPGQAAGPGPLKVPHEQLASVLGTRAILVKPHAALRVNDTALAVASS